MTVHFQPVRTPRSYASRVQSVRSPGGVEAWLIEDHSLPIVVTSFAFRGGAALDPAGKGGATRLLGGLLTEGSGAMDASAFQQALADDAIRLSFEISRDRLGGGLMTLSHNVERAFALLGQALRDPHFDAAAIERKRDLYVADVRMTLGRPQMVASESFWARAYAGHPYARSVSGDLASLAAVGRDDLLALRHAMLTRGGLVVGVVGAIDAAALGQALDAAFADLPAGDAAPIPPVELQGLGERIVTPVDGPQSVIYFGRPGVALDDRDFPAAMLMTRCLGGGNLTSRLFTEIREKRGLCYSIGCGLDVIDGASCLVGSTSTRNELAFEALALVEAELRRLATDGIPADELAAAKSAMIGSYDLGLDTSRAIAGLLRSTQFTGHGVDWLDERNRRLAAVTPQDMARAIERIVGDGSMLVAIAGQPQGAPEPSTAGSAP